MRVQIIFTALFSALAVAAPVPLDVRSPNPKAQGYGRLVALGQL
jgi:hypothetical protein